MELEQVKIAHNSLFSLRFSHFSCIHTPFMVVNLWLISKLLEKLILTILPVFSLLLWKQILRSSYSTIFADVTPSNCFSAKSFRVILNVCLSQTSQHTSANPIPSKYIQGPPTHHYLQCYHPEISYFSPFTYWFPTPPPHLSSDCQARSYFKLLHFSTRYAHGSFLYLPSNHCSNDTSSEMLS